MRNRRRRKVSSRVLLPPKAEEGGNRSEWWLCEQFRDPLKRSCWANDQIEFQWENQQEKHLLLQLCPWRPRVSTDQTEMSKILNSLRIRLEKIRTWRLPNAHLSVSSSNHHLLRVEHLTIILLFSAHKIKVVKRVIKNLADENRGDGIDSADAKTRCNRPMQFVGLHQLCWRSRVRPTPEIHLRYRRPRWRTAAISYRDNTTRW